MPHTRSWPRLHYRVEGSGEPPVLLVMGFSMEGEVWRPQVDGLAAHHRVVFFDHRGVGRSDLPAERPWTMRDMAADALRVADAAGLDRFHLVGVSMGGMISQELALAVPERLLSLSLIATHAGGGRAYMPTPQGVRCFLMANLGPRRKRLRALTELLYPPGWVASADQKALARRMRGSVGRPQPWPTLRAQMHAIRHHDTEGRLGSLRVPTLIVKPSLDILIRPRESDRLHRLIPDARLVTYDDAGHGVLFQHADAINTLLLDHFGDGVQKFKRPPIRS